MLATERQGSVGAQAMLCRAADLFLVVEPFLEQTARADATAEFNADLELTGALLNRGLLIAAGALRSDRNHGTPI